MADNVSGGLPNAGKTYHGGTPGSVGRSTELEGTTMSFRDEIRSGYGPRRLQSGEYRHARLVRNVSGISLEPKRLVTWAPAFFHKRVNGYSRLDGAEVAGVVDPDLPAAGVKNNDLFWLFYKGPCLVKTPLAGTAFDDGDIIGALTAASSQAATAGRPGKVATASTQQAASSIINRVGRVMSAMTVGQTNADMLVGLDIQG